jgi:hypothetical protein
MGINLVVPHCEREKMGLYNQKYPETKLQNTSVVLGNNYIPTT